MVIAAERILQKNGCIVSISFVKGEAYPGNDYFQIICSAV